MNIDHNTLLRVLTNMLGKEICHAEYQAEKLHGGTLGDIRLVTGVAEASRGDKMPYRVVVKTQKKWERYGDPGSWRREYDLYTADLDALFMGSLRRPV